MTRKEAYRETLRNFRTGKIDILVGTQMIAKGLHFPNVTLVGIINADLALHLPDFRAGERTFQLLTQVAGRAGRGETHGEVFVQTYTPFSPSIQFARHHDFTGYFQQELEFRERCDFPPFKHAVLITVRSGHEGRAKLSAETLKRRLSEALPEEFILGDATPAPLEKLQGQFRFHILIRGEAIMNFQQILSGRIAGWIMQLLYGVRYTDMCPFRAIRRDALEKLDMREETYGWNLEMQMKSARVGLRILEIPVNHRCRTGGESKVSGTLRGTFVAGTRIIATLFRVALSPKE